MALYGINYDLIKRKDYPELWKALEQLGAFRTLASFWLANLTNEDPQEVVDHLHQFIDADDKLMVVRFIGKPKFTTANRGTNDWISANT
jgi:CRISPR/Cas system-associated endoribonuclease Cas2